MTRKSKNEFDWIFRMMFAQRELLAGKSDALFELYRMCDSENQLNLVSSLVIWAVSDCVSADLRESFLNEYLHGIS